MEELMKLYPNGIGRPGLSGISLGIAIRSALPPLPNPVRPASATATGDEITEISSESDSSSDDGFDMSVILCTGKWASSPAPRIPSGKS